MLIKAKIENQSEWLFLEEIPDKYTADHRISEKRVTIKDAPIGMNNYQVSTNGLFLLYSEMRFDEQVRILTEVEGEAIACQFIFNKLDPSKKKVQQTYGRSRHNIRYIPSSKEAYDIKPNVDYIYFLAVLSKDYYLHLVDVASPLHEGFVREMERGIYTSFADTDLSVTPEMRRSIEEIRACKQDGAVKRLFTDARMLELIMYQLEQFSQSMDDEEDVLRDEDITKLEAARGILEEQFRQPPTQKQLSKMILLNEFKLRSGFKKYYGSTIYDYITRLRMEEARKLIVKEKKNMYEVGMLVGFKHQASFTKSFKKYYGITPSDVKA